MKTQNTLLLLVVAAAIGGAIYYVNQQEQEIVTSAAIPVESIDAVTSGTVERILISAPGEKPVTLTRGTDDAWYTNVEKKYAADSSAVNNVLGAVDEPIEANVVSSNPDSFSDYQVDETSGVKVQVFAKGKSEPAMDLIVGKDGPSAFSTYVRHAGEDAVLNAKASLSMTFKRPDGWRNKQIFEFTGTNATRIEATGTSQTFTVARENTEGKWAFEKPEATEAEAARIDSIANMLSSLRANEFVDPASSQTLADFGLEPPRQTIKLTYADKSTSPAKSQSVSLLVGKESNTPGDWYAKREDKNDVFTIGQSIADALLPDPKSLMIAKPEPPPAVETTATATATTATEAAVSVTTPTEVAPVSTPVATPSPADTPVPESTPVPALEATTTVTDSITTTP